MLTRADGARPARRPGGPRPYRSTAGGRGGAARRSLAGAALALLLTLGAAVPAIAAGRADPGAECPPGQSDCSVWDDDPGTPGDPGGGGDDGGGGDSGGGGGAAKCQWNGRTVKCYDSVLGWFNNSDGCYYKLAEPQPEAPEGQQWYVAPATAATSGSQTTVLRDAPPPGFGAPPDPEELARRALAKITIAAPRIAVAPRAQQRSRPGRAAGLDVGPQRRPEVLRADPAGLGERAGPDRTITAKFDRIVWNMGNGRKVTCPGAGTPYRADGPFAGRPSPDCGYQRLPEGRRLPGAGHDLLEGDLERRRPERRHRRHPDHGNGPGPNQRTTGGGPVSARSEPILRAPQSTDPEPGRWTRRSPRPGWSGSGGCGPGCSAWPCC